MTITRKDGRRYDELRDISLELGVLPYAEGSCLVKFGNTHVLCTASVEERVPTFLRGRGKGWVTAEYSMLPRATENRAQRENGSHGIKGRTQEIQRLIGRVLRMAVLKEVLGERQIIIDCDVIRADGGTRTAAITGGFIALQQATNDLLKRRVIKENPIKHQIMAISCGIINGIAALDLDYREDKEAEVDGNFIFTGNGEIVEIQCAAENATFSAEQLNKMLSLAQVGVSILQTKQNQIFSNL